MERLGDLSVFVAVAAAGSFTAAAERLGITKSVASRCVTRLEDRLGVRLLHRTTRRLSLTEAGERLHARSARALEEIEEAEREVSAQQDRPRGRLRVAVPMSFGLMHVAPALPDFLREQPLVSVDLRLDDRQVEVVGGGIDVALRIAELADSSLVARRLATIRHVTVAAPAYLRARGTPRHPADLAAHACLVYTLRAQPNVWRYRDRAGREIAVQVGGALQANNSLALRDALLAGAGIAHTPNFVVGEDLASGRLVPLLAEYGTLELGLYAIVPERKHLTPKAQVFVDFCARRFRELPVPDAPPVAPRRRARRG